MTFGPRSVCRRLGEDTGAAYAAGRVAPKRSEGGFSLLELSIVLIIIGLVAGVSVDMGLYTIDVVKRVANDHSSPAPAEASPSLASILGMDSARVSRSAISTTI